MRIIAIEEHFWTPMLQRNMPSASPRTHGFGDLSERLGFDVPAALSDLGNARIAAMDEAGIDVQVVSLTQPGCERFAPDIAVPMARDSNDRLFEAIKHSQRFAGFAALPCGDPDAAAKELERSVSRLGFKGALINGHVPGSFLDERKYWSIFESAQALRVPIYLHPAAPHAAAMAAYYDGFEDLSQGAWGFMVDTSIHFLRLVFAGVFDAFPDLKIMLGHLGEALPFGLDRLDDHSYQAAAHRGLKKRPAQYLKDNLLVTTSGNFSIRAFECARDALGVDKILFAVDWPYESNQAATEFLKQLPVSDEEREKIAHLNAERLLRL
jgi:2,3-dihydroxybenzoate decarboxylase